MFRDTLGENVKNIPKTDPPDEMFWDRRVISGELMLPFGAFGSPPGDLSAAFGTLWGCLGTPWETMPKTYLKQTLPIIS